MRVPLPDPLPAPVPLGRRQVLAVLAALIYVIAVVVLGTGTISRDGPTTTQPTCVDPAGLVVDCDFGGEPLP